ncbi:MAG: SOS response-associated peptidase [Solirubrobacteraceae bacterium]|nr:SOS response-associated peptidase [Solirubrobacteraceae bacterium]
MCGRYRTKADSQEDFTQRWGAWGKSIAGSMGQIELRPTDPIAIVMERDGERRAEAVRWGFQPPNSKRPLINARDDKLLTQGLWKRSLAEPRGRILIPSDGWYEWLSAEDPKVKKQPFLHTVDGGAEFAFAGLLGYAIVKGERVPAATIITTSSAGAAARIHDRMPVVLPDAESEELWLRGEDPEALVEELCVPLAGNRVTVEPIELPSNPSASKPKKAAPAQPTLLD